MSLLDVETGAKLEGELVVRLAGSSQAVASVVLRAPSSAPAFESGLASALAAASEPAFEWAFLLERVFS